MIEVGYTKGRPMCRLCRERVEKDELRLRVHSYGNYPKSYHIKCYVERYIDACLEIGRCAEEIVLQAEAEGKVLVKRHEYPGGYRFAERIEEIQD